MVPRNLATEFALVRGWLSSLNRAEVMARYAALRLSEQEVSVGEVFAKIAGAVRGAWRLGAAIVRIADRIIWAALLSGAAYMVYTGGDTAMLLLAILALIAVSGRQIRRIGYETDAVIRAEERSFPIHQRDNRN